jgi:antitoxin component YwqK of YwqJK toxin-antitoxin module
MKYLLILSCLLFTSVSWSKDVNSDDLVKRDGLYYEKFTDVPFTGNSIGKYQGKISKGKLEGEWLRYYWNGQLQEKRNYKKGKWEGEQLEYYDNGQLKSKGNFKDDKREGVSSKYYDNGQLNDKGNFKNGKLDGEYLQYNENGQLEKTEIYKDGKLIETITP